MMYLWPAEDVTGKRPVWSDATRPLRSIAAMKASFVRVPGGELGVGTVISMVAALSVGLGDFASLLGELVLFLFLDVDLMPCLFSFWCPLYVDRGLGRCLRTASEVSPGQDTKYPASIAAHQVATVGLKAAACRNAIKSALVLWWYAVEAAFAMGVWLLTIVCDGVRGMSHNPLRGFLEPIWVACSWMRTSCGWR